MEFTDYSDAFTSERISLFVRKNSPIQWDDDLNNLSNYKFARVRGFYSGPLFEHFLANGTINLIESTQTIHLLKMLLARRYDIMVEDSNVALYELNKLGRLGDIKQLAIIQEHLSYLGFSKKRNRQSTIEKFNNVLQKMKDDGSYQKIINDFYQK